MATRQQLQQEEILLNKCITVRDQNISEVRAVLREVDNALAQRKVPLFIQGKHPVTYLRQRVLLQESNKKEMDAFFQIPDNLLANQRSETISTSSSNSKPKRYWVKGIIVFFGFFFAEILMSDYDIIPNTELSVTLKFLIPILAARQVIFFSHKYWVKRFGDIVVFLVVLSIAAMYFLT